MSDHPRLPARTDGSEAGPLARALHALGLNRARRGAGMTLSPQECEIIWMVAGDRTNKEIGTILGISHWTVATHLRHIFARLGVHSKAAMVVQVIRAAEELAERSPVPDPSDPPQNS